MEHTFRFPQEFFYLVNFTEFSCIYLFIDFIYLGVKS